MHHRLAHAKYMHYHDVNEQGGAKLNWTTGTHERVASTFYSVLLWNLNQLFTFFYHFQTHEECSLLSPVLDEDPCPMHMTVISSLAVVRLLQTISTCI